MRSCGGPCRCGRCGRTGDDDQRSGRRSADTLRCARPTAQQLRPCDAGPNNPFTGDATSMAHVRPPRGGAGDGERHRDHCAPPRARRPARPGHDGRDTRRHTLALATPLRGTAARPA
jgi:hypothetical protein